MRRGVIPLLAMLAAVGASPGAPDPFEVERPRRRVTCSSCGAIGAARVEAGGRVRCPACGSLQVSVGPVVEEVGVPVDEPPPEPPAEALVAAAPGPLGEIRDRFGPIAAVVALVVARGLPPGSSLTVSDAGAVSFSLPEGWVDPWVEAGDALWIVALASIPAPPSQVAESVLRRLRARNDGATVPDAPEPGDVDPDVATG